MLALIEAVAWMPAKRALWCSWRHRWQPTRYGWERPACSSCLACLDKAPRGGKR